MQAKIVQNTDAWIAWRKQGIGASDVAPLVGIYKYSTPYKVWSEKTGLSVGFKGNFATERGNELEAKARAKYELLTMEDMPPATAIHPKWPVCRVSLDGIREDQKLILEIKCPGEEAHAFAKAGEVPSWYVPQVQYQLAVTGADELHYFSFGKDESDALVIVKPDLEYQGRLIATVLEFWEKHVVANVAPPLTEFDDKLIDSGHVAEICLDIVENKDSLTKADLDKMKRRVIELGGHSRVRSGRVLVTRSAGKNGTDVYRLTVAK